jgi:hypothetical protein
LDIPRAEKWLPIGIFLKCRDSDIKAKKRVFQIIYSNSHNAPAARRCWLVRMGTG